MIALETERLILRNYHPSDFKDIFAYFSNEEVSRYEDFYPMSEEQVPVSYTTLRAHGTGWNLVCRPLLEKIKHDR